MSPDRGRGRAAPRQSPCGDIPEWIESRAEDLMHPEPDGDDEAASETYEKALDAAAYDDAWRYDG